MSLRSQSVMASLFERDMMGRGGESRWDRIKEKKKGPEESKAVCF